MKKKKNTAKGKKNWKLCKQILKKSRKGFFSSGIENTERKKKEKKKKKRKEKVSYFSSEEESLRIIQSKQLLLGIINWKKKTNKIGVCDY